MAEQKSTNVQWHHGEIQRDQRYQLIAQKGATIWFTGLSGSGKSSVAVALEKALFNMNKLCYRLDGDNIRLGINKNLGFSAEDRAENIRRIGEIAKLFCDTGVVTLSSFVSPYKSDRRIVRKMHVDAGIPFIEVFMKISLAAAEERDPKGLYKKARAGKIKNFTGIDDPYEEPEAPEIILDSEVMSLEQEVEVVLSYLQETGVLSA